MTASAAHAQSGFTALSKHDHLQRWRELVEANEPVITQVDEGHTTAGDIGWSPSSSCSKPSIVAAMLDALELRPGHSVLEIGTGTGWNAALLCRRVGTHGQVVSIEVDPVLAQGARAALAAAGYSPLVITGDGNSMTSPPDHGHGWMPTSPHRTPSLSTNSAHADCGTKPSPPTTGGTTTANPTPPASG